MEVVMGLRCVQNREGLQQRPKVSGAVHERVSGVELGMPQVRVEVEARWVSEGVPQAWWVWGFAQGCGLGRRRKEAD
jgi:hypothetical protein